MTVREVYIMAAALIGDKENDDLNEKQLTVPYMNIILQEALDTENSIRLKDSEELLTAAPIVTSLDDELTYHDQLVRAAFPYGLAWQYARDENNLGLADQYRNLFVDAVERNQCFTVRRDDRCW